MWPLNEKGGMRSLHGHPPWTRRHSGADAWVSSPAEVCSLLGASLELGLSQPARGATVNKTITSNSTEATRQTLVRAVPPEPPTSALTAAAASSSAAHPASSGTKTGRTESALPRPPLGNHSRVSCCRFNPHFLVHKGGPAAFNRCACLLPRTTLAPVCDQIPIMGHSGKFLLSFS